MNSVLNPKIAADESGKSCPNGAAYNSRSDGQEKNTALCIVGRFLSGCQQTLIHLQVRVCIYVYNKYIQKKRYSKKIIKNK